MKPTFFGESRDIAKRQIMLWLAPGERWAVHPMWYEDRPNPPLDQPFLDSYARALNVDIVHGESRIRNQFLHASQTCGDHLLLDPDTGLSIKGATSNQLIAIGDFIHIVNSPNRSSKLTLVYDQSYSRGENQAKFRERVEEKLQLLRNGNVHAVAYMAEPSLKVCFIWASVDAKVVTEATQRMQQESHFPTRRFMMMDGHASI